MFLSKGNHFHIFLVRQVGSLLCIQIERDSLKNYLLKRRDCTLIDLAVIPFCLVLQYGQGILEMIDGNDDPVNRIDHVRNFISASAADSDAISISSKYFNRVIVAEYPNMPLVLIRGSAIFYFEGMHRSGSVLQVRKSHVSQ